jgi:hypothetical protein
MKEHLIAVFWAFIYVAVFTFGLACVFEEYPLEPVRKPAAPELKCELKNVGDKCVFTYQKSWM